MLPADFAIFSWPRSRPSRCASRAGRGARRAPPPSARSRSRGGGRRGRSRRRGSRSRVRAASRPSPSTRCAIRAGPSPHGRGQPLSSSGLRAFQSAKSSGSSLRSAAPGLLALVHLGGIAVREPAVAVEAPHAEVHVAAGLVGVAGVDQRLDQRHDLARASRRPAARASGRPSPSRSVSSTYAAVISLGQLGRGHAGGAGRVVDLVVDVGDVDDQRRPVALVREEAPQEHEDDERARVADVDPRVGGRPAGVDPDPSAARAESSASSSSSARACRRTVGIVPSRRAQASSRFRTLPVALRGSDSRNSTSRGILKRARWLSHVVAHRRPRRGRLPSRDDERLQPLAELLVVDADHRDLGDLRVVAPAGPRPRAGTRSRRRRRSSRRRGRRRTAGRRRRNARRRRSTAARRSAPCRRHRCSPRRPISLPTKTRPVSPARDRAAVAGRRSRPTVPCGGRPAVPGAARRSSGVAIVAQATSVEP